MNDLHDHDGLDEIDFESYYADGVDAADYTVTGCDPAEYEPNIVFIKPLSLQRVLDILNEPA